MSAKKRGIIGLVIGAVFMPAFMLMETTGNLEVLDILVYVGVGALYGFGFAFGWGYLKTITSKLLGAATGASIFTILTSRENTWLKVFFIYLFAIALAFAIAWIPGVVKGIVSIVQEHQAAA